VIIKKRRSTEQTKSPQTLTYDKTDSKAVVCM